MKIIEANNREAWDNFIKSHKESNFLQSWDFYAFHASRGQKIVRKICLNDDNKIIAAYAGVVETAKRGTHLAIAGGPIMNWDNQKLVKFVFDDIKNEGIKHNCVFIRVRPQLEKSNQSLKLLESIGLKPAPMYLSVEYAGILDLKNSEEDLLKNASQGFRRKLRKAEKANIEVTTSTDPEIINTFYDLEIKHAARQGFVPFSRDYLKKQFTAFSEHDEAIIYIAKLDSEILAMNFMIFYGPEASYHYGVSSDLGTKYSAAPLLHLEAIREAKNRHCLRYNLWGIVAKDETTHRFYGVSEFKRSFGCEELKYTPAHDLILKPTAYLKTYLVETARKKFRHV